MMISLFLLLVCGAGFWTLLNRTVPSLASLVAELPTIIALGIICLHIEFLLLSWRGEVALLNLALLPALLLGLLIWSFFQGKIGREQNEAADRKNWQLRSLLLFLLALQIAALLPMLQLPLFDWEGRMLWALKARFLEESPTVLAEPFRDPYCLHIHPRYPLLLPWLSASITRVGGGFQELHYLMLLLTFALLTGWHFFVFLVRRIGLLSAFLVSLILMSSSIWLTAVINAQVEIVLVFFALLALTRLLDWLEHGRWQDLVLTVMFLVGGAMTKNEGLLLALVFFAVVMLLALLKMRLNSREAWLFPGLFSVLYLPWLLHLRLIPAVADENYLQQLNSAALLHGVARLSQIFASYLTRMSDWPLWHIYWFVLPATVVWSLLLWRKSTLGEKVVALVWVGYFVGVTGVYILSPWQDISLHISASFDRAFLPLLPCGLILVALWSQRVMTMGVGDGLADQQTRKVDQ
jgi:hypothetical protein